MINDRDIFSSKAETGQLMRSIDWSATPLGPLEEWPQSLRTSVSVCLNSAFPILLWWGPELVMLYNDAYAPLISKKHPRALGSRGCDVFPEIWDTIGPMLESVMGHGEAVRANDLLLFLERNGYPEECYFTFSYSPILDESRGVGGVFTPVHETTERVIGERRLRTLTQLAAVRTAKSASAEDTCRSLALVLASNQRDVPFAAIYLFDEAHSTARRVAVTGVVGQALAPDTADQQAEWPPVGAILNGETPVVNSSLFPQSEVPHGFWRDHIAQLIALPLTIPGGEKPRGFMVLGVNPRKRLDESYRSFFSLVAEHVSAAISDSEALAQERRRAEALAEIDRAKTVFFSNASHEFRTPLSLILGPLEELRGDPTIPPEAQERLELARRNGLRLQKVVNNLLDFSRIEAGRLQAIFEPVDLAQLTEELAGSFRSTYEKAGLTLTVNALPFASPVYIDRDMWEKIILNLLSNAFKFTFQGGVTITLKEQDGEAKVIVRDTGTGIPASELPKIFQRFQRVEGARGRSIEGTGIGLALVHELVRMHGGSIQAESQVDQGTSFTITIPTGTSHLQKQHLGRSRESFATAARLDAFVSEALRWIPEESPNGTPLFPDTEEVVYSAHIIAAKHRRRVLLVDDNADMRQYVARLLKDRFDVTTAANGQEALAVIHQTRPDIVISDVMMPVMDGFRLLSAIRGDVNLSSLPVILLSARAGEESEIEGLRAGADDYLVKPFSAREFVARVTSALAIAEVRTAAEAAFRLSESRVREVLERTTDGVCLLDREWRFTFLNAHAESMIAGGRDLLNQNVWEAFPDAASRKFWTQYQRVMNDRVAVEFEEYYPAPLDKWFEVHAYPTEEGVAIFFRDITTKRHTELAIRQTEKLAAVGRLASSISHEINNPLEAVTNLLYLIDSDSSLSDASRSYLDTAQAELARVSHIANQTLRFYRQGATPAPTDIREVLDSVTSLYDRRFRDADIQVERGYSRSRAVPGFAVEFRQVFANLVANALDAIGSHGRIVLREREATDWRTGRRGVRVTVADTGRGMSRETQRQLFQPFFSTKGTTGTGLGLWVSKDIVERHGGHIRLRTNQHPMRHGTVFTVFLPFESAVKKANPEFIANSA